MKAQVIRLVVAGFLLAIASPAALVGPHATLTFEPGKAVLTKDAESKIAAVVKDGRSAGKISEIQVAAWSDNPAPREGEQLSTSDRDLAQKRVDAVKTCLSRYKVSAVQSYNMAEGASWLARSFKTDNAELKSEVGQGAEGGASKPEIQVFKESGAPSKAVVIAIMEPRTIH